MSDDAITLCKESSDALRRMARVYGISVEAALDAAVDSYLDAMMEEADVKIAFDALGRIDGVIGSPEPALNVAVPVAQVVARQVETQTQTYSKTIETVRTIGSGRKLQPGDAAFLSDDERARISDRVRAARQTSSISQGKLAAELGLSQTQMSLIESADRGVSRANCEKAERWAAAIVGPDKTVAPTDRRSAAAMVARQRERLGWEHYELAREIGYSEASIRLVEQASPHASQIAVTELSAWATERAVEESQEIEAAEEAEEAATTPPDQEYRERMMRENEGLVVFLIHKQGLFGAGAARGMEPDDVLQAGRIGLLHAIDRFDESKGFKFSSYAALCIRGLILQEINSRGKSKMDRAAEYKGEAVSYSSIDTSGLDGGPIDFASLAPISDAIVDAKLVRRSVVRALRSLPIRERRIINRRFFHEQTLNEAGAALGISKESARLAEVSGLAMLRSRIADEPRAVAA